MSTINVSNYDYMDKTILVVGTLGTAVAVGGVVAFYATAGIGFAAAAVMILVDSATVILLGGLSTGIVWYTKGLIKQVCFA
jgi:hypothetical protein